MNKKISFLLFVVVLISGYVSLALELLAMRQIIPYLGNDTIIASIIIGIVLIFLSIGYYASGKMNIRKDSIRQIILKNFVISTIFIFAGTSYIFLPYYFKTFEYIGLTNRIAQAFAFSLLLLAVPSYLLAQTTPLISNYFSKNLSGKMTGKMLFYGTIGSFGGSILTTLFIMPFFGVNYAAMFNMFLITVAILILNNRNKIEIYLASFLFLAITFMFNNSIIERKIGILSNNEYSTIKILDTDDSISKIMLVNNSYSSKVSQNKNLMFEYVKYINDNFISTIPKDKVRNILVLGAGGFTIGIDDEYNNYTYVDIDRSILEISEKYFLQKDLDNNKQFVAKDARNFLKNNNQKYDLIVLDTYSNALDIPTHLVTTEYFNDVKNSLEDNGIMVANIVASANLEDNFSITIDNTIKFVFKNVQREVIQNYNPWLEEKQISNIIYIYYNKTINLNKVYTDNNNSVIFDK
ncbi:MAG: fused MFS/spermidine synthase [Rickettsiales bacterium]|nr:fused MFS/spermidine synthase [Rickettsiales bacterium]